MLISATFLPLTLSVVGPDPRPGAGPVADAVHRVELDARAAWASLLGDPDTPVRGDLAVDVRRLSLAVGGFVGTGWWHADGRAHRDRVAGYQLWLEESLAEGDGAGFARAFAGYDEALARVMVRALGCAPGWPAAIAGHRSGTMAGWARQARAATFRVTMRATRRHRGPWTTSAHGTSSSRWSRRSRSAG